METIKLQVSEKLTQHPRYAERLKYAFQIFNEHFSKGMKSPSACLEDLSMKSCEQVTLKDGRTFDKGAFLSSQDRLAVYKYACQVIEATQPAKAEEARQALIRQHEEYLAYLDKVNKEALRHLRFTDDVELVLDVVGNFKEDNRPAFGDSYRERENAKSDSESDVEELMD